MVKNSSLFSFQHSIFLSVQFSGWFLFEILHAAVGFGFDFFNQCQAFTFI